MCRRGWRSWPPPERDTIRRSTRIEASPEKIYPLIDNLRGNARWPPYHMKDPAMKGAYNNEVGSGRVTITDSQAPRRVRMRLQMFKPFAADNTVEFTLLPQGGAIEVTAGGNAVVRPAGVDESAEAEPDRSAASGASRRACCCFGVNPSQILEDLGEPIP